MLNTSQICKFLLPLSLLAPTAVQALLIDDFTSLQSISVDALTPPSLTVGDSAAAAVPGLERDIAVTKTAGIAGDRIRVRTNPGGQSRLRYSSESGVNGSALLVYDGADGDALSIDFTGLGGLDLFAGSASAFEIDLLFADISGPATVTVFDAADATGATFASSTISLPATSTTTTIELLFSSFTTSNATSVPTIFGNAGAIALLIDGTLAPDQTSWDVELGQFQTNGVPAPAGAGLLLLGSAFLGWRRQNPQP